ncbi:phage regulatory CII family protein [Erythrobacter sp. NE805]|uniref:phage regulatory CII family protein n=1 Tax=Erythrobacter sp. NE805 TaxID=3389875 RepID=UPI00396B2A64
MPNPSLKLAVRAAIKAGGGIKNAAHVCGVSETQAGRWNCLTDHDLPKREHLGPLDELAMAASGRAPILEELARQLGHVAFPLPEAHGEGQAVAVQLAEATAEFGQIAQAVVAGLADGRLDAGESAAVATEIDDALRALGRLRALVVDDEALVASSASAAGRQGAGVRAV